MAMEIIRVKRFTTSIHCAQIPGSHEIVHMIPISDLSALHFTRHYSFIFPNATKFLASVSTSSFLTEMIPQDIQFSVKFKISCT